MPAPPLPFVQAFIESRGPKVEAHVAANLARLNINPHRCVGAVRVFGLLPLLRVREWGGSSWAAPPAHTLPFS